MSGDDCELCDARKDPTKWFPLALLSARTNAPIEKSETCRGCGEYVGWKEFMRQQTLRCELLKVGRGQPWHPSRSEMREICEWMIRWGVRPDNLFLSYAQLQSPPDSQGLVPG